MHLHIAVEMFSVDENCQFVVDPLTYPQPVQLTEKWRHMDVRTSVMSRPTERRRSTPTAADRSDMPGDRRVCHPAGELVSPAEPRFLSTV